MADAKVKKEPEAKKITVSYYQVQAVESLFKPEMLGSYYQNREVKNLIRPLSKYLEEFDTRKCMRDMVNFLIYLGVYVTGFLNFHPLISFKI